MYKIIRMNGARHHRLILSILDVSCPIIHGSGAQARLGYVPRLRVVSTAAHTNVMDAQDWRKHFVPHPAYPVHPC
jgi:hypothetical protein